MMRRGALWALVGVTVGFALSLWLGPTAVTWWFAPPGGTGNVFTCETQIRSATNYLVMMQLIVAAVLGVLAFVGALLRGSKKPRDEQPGPAGPAASS